MIDVLIGGCLLRRHVTRCADCHAERGDGIAAGASLIALADAEVRNHADGRTASHWPLHVAVHDSMLVGVRGASVTSTDPHCFMDGSSPSRPSRSRAIAR